MKPVTPVRLCIVIAALTIQFLSSAVMLAGQITVHVRSLSGGEAPSRVYVGVVREDTPWREPLLEAMLRENEHSLEWTVPPDRYRVVAGAPGWTTFYSDPVQVGEVGAVNVDAGLRLLRPVTGGVRGPAGEPVPHARVGVIRAFVLDASQRLSDKAEEHLRLNSIVPAGADGRFLFPAHPTAAHLLYIEADGYAPRLLQGVTVRDASALREITLGRGASLEVKPPDAWIGDYDRIVLIPDGTLPDGLSRDLALALWSRSPQTPATWPSLPAGRYRIAFDHSWGAADAVPNVVASVDLAPGDARVLSVPPPQRIAAPAPAKTRIRTSLFLPNADSGARRAVVSRWSLTDEKPVTAKVDEVSGGMRLRLADDCHAGVRYFIRTPREVGVAFVARETECKYPLATQLRPSADGFVQLRAPIGSRLPPRAMASVRSCGLRSSLLGEYPATIAADGKATFSLPSGCTATTLLVGTFAPVLLGETTTGTGARHAFPSVQLESGGVILARVISADGSPADGVSVSAVLRDEVDGTMSLDAVSPVVSVVTRQGGWARLAGIPARDVVLLLASGARRNPQVTDSYRIDSGQQLLVDPLAILPPATVTVSVDPPTIAAERGVELLNAALISGDGNRWPKRTPLQAVFEGDHATFTDVPAGEWKLAVYARLPAQLATVVGSSTLTVVPGQAVDATVAMTRFARRGRVLLRGKGVRGMLTLRAPMSSPTTVPADAEGSFTALLQAGTYEVELAQNAREGSLGYVKVAEVDIPEGDGEIRIDLPSARLTGRVVSADGEAVAGATVRATALRFRGEADRPSTLMESELEVRSGGDGRFAFEAVPAGAWTIEAAHRKQQSDRPTVTLAEQQDLTGVTLHLSGGEEITGQVIDSRGMPAAGAQVVVSTPDRNGGLPRIDWADAGPRGEFTVTFRSASIGTPADVKVRTRDGAVAASRQNLNDPLLIQLRPSGDVEIERSETEDPAPLLEVLVRSDGSMLSVSFCSTSRFVRDGKSVLRITQLEVGEWRYVTARTPAEVAAVINGAATSIPPASTFIVHPAATTVAVAGNSPTKKGTD